MHRWLLVPVLLAAVLLAGGPAYADDPPVPQAPPTAAAPAQADPGTGAAPATPGAPAAAAATDPGGAPATTRTFGVQPSSATEPDTRGTFTYGATPGAILKDHVAVWNYSDQPLTLRLYPADAYNTDSGGYDVLPEGTASTRAGSWLRTAAGSLTLPARSRQIVPFTLAVPADATPGDHPAGIVVALRTETKDAKGNAVTVDQRVGARVNVRVSGELKARLAVEDVEASHHPSLNPFDGGHTTISYAVRNTGNVRLGGKHAVRVANVFGTIATGDTPPDLQELLPGNVVRYRFDVSGAYPTFLATAGITVDPLPVAGDKDPALVSSVSKHRFTSVPWALLAVLVPLAVLGGWWWRDRRRRRAATSAAPAGEAPRTPAAAGAALLAVLLAGPLLAQLAAAPAARAAEPAGTLAFDYATGRDDDPLDLLSSAQCPDPAADYLTVRISGAGFPAEGAPLTGTVPASVYRTAANGGYVLPLSNTLRVVATRSGSGPLNGAYTITATCRGKVNPASKRDFTGVLTFTAPTTWTAATVAPDGMIHAAAAAEPAQPQPGATRPAPTAVAAAPAAAEGGVPWYSLLAIAAGTLLLGRIALPYVRRWHAARRPEPEAAE
ncbi:hypothetical protein ACWEQL_38835 [Kitasatospora sp. NPDC004240]